MLVTGASSGIGLETALHLAARGLPVCATIRDLSRRSTIDEQATRRNVTLDVLPLDITSQASVDSAVRTLVERYGGIAAVVNNAGLQLRGYFEDQADDEIRHVFDVNLFGTMAVTRAVLPVMRAARTGRIVIVGSIGGLIGSPALSSYCASKHALEGFGEALSLEVAALGIHVSLVEPAIVRTAIWRETRGIARAARNPSSPYHGWFATGEELADRVVATAPTTAAEVAEAVHLALTAARPRLRYFVGRRAGLLLLLRRYLPAALFETLYFDEVIRRITGVRP